MPQSLEPSKLFAVNPDVQPEQFILDKDVCTLGRSPVCDIIMDVKIISRLHAKIERDFSRYVLYDANSANGTFINGHRILDPYVLQNQDSIGLGAAEPLLRFEDADPTAQVDFSRLRYEQQTMMFFLSLKKLELTPSEFRLLRLLYQHANQVCTRERCAEAIWEYEYQPDPDNDPLNRVVSNLRRKFKKIDPSADMIKTHRGVGYILHP